MQEQPPSAHHSSSTALLAFKFWFFKIVGAYFVVGILWLEGFDGLLGTITHNSLTLFHGQSLKSWGLWLIGLGMLYWVSLQSERRLALAITEQEQVQEALRASKERFRQVTENIHEVFWMSSVDKNEVLYISPAYETIWGRTCASLYQNPRSFIDSIHPDDRERVLANLPQQKQGGYSQEYRIIQPNGSLRWILDRAYPVQDETGEVYRIVGVAKDITDRKQAEAALKESREFFKLSLDFNRIGSWDWHISSNEVTWNDNHARLLGLVPGEVEPSYRAWRDRVHPEDIDRVARTVINALESHTNFRVEYRVIYPDGSLHWVDGRGQGICDEMGQPVRMIGVILDITDRKQAEQEIQTLNQTLEQHNAELETLVEQRTAELLTLINTLPDYIFVIDRKEMKFLFCNEQNAHFIGFASRNQVEGKTIFECFSPEQAAELARQNQQVFESGEISHFQAAYPTSNGRRHLDTYKIPLKQPNGEVYALIGAARDITELVETRQQIVDRTVQLEAANRELESFSYSVSHDLRAPLRHINSFILALGDRLQKQGHLTDPKASHYLQIIEGSSKKMGQLVDGLLTLSRAGRRPMTLLPVDLNPLVESAFAQLAQGMAPGGAAATVTEKYEAQLELIIGDLPIVLGDATLLLQVFVNLLDNALKFSHDRCPAQIEIGTLPDGAIFIRDNGVGFDMEYADQLFGAFQRLHSAAEFEGTGIGLAIVQRIIHRHGGTIWAESRPHQGATFFLKLSPASPVSPPLPHDS